MVAVCSSYFWPAVTTIPNTHNLKVCFGLWCLRFQSLRERVHAVEHVAEDPHRANRKQREQGGSQGLGCNHRRSLQGTHFHQRGFTSRRPPQPASAAGTDGGYIFSSVHTWRKREPAGTFRMETLACPCEMTPVRLLTHYQAFLPSLMGQHPCMHTCR